MTFFLILFCSGLFISAIAAWVSIIGLSSIFPGAVFIVTLMGIALELGKLTSVSWLYRFWNKTNIILKTYFTIAILILSVINSIGVFGYLSKAHIEGTQGIEAGTDQISLLDAQIAVEQQTVEADRNALKQMDAAVNNLTASERTTERAVRVRTSQRRERTSLNAEIAASNKKIIELQQQKSVLNVSQRKLETDVGPIKYVAQFVYGNKDADTIEHSVTILILILICVFDPLAILLLVAANMQLAEAKKRGASTDSKAVDPEIPVIPQIPEETVLEPILNASSPPETEETAAEPAESVLLDGKTHDIALTKKLLNHLKSTS